MPPEDPSKFSVVAGSERFRFQIESENCEGNNKDLRGMEKAAGRLEGNARVREGEHGRWYALKGYTGAC